MRGVVFTLLLALAAGCDTQKPQPTQAASRGDSTTAKPRPSAKPRPRQSVERPASAEVVEPGQGGLPRREAFVEAWEKAVKAGEDLDREEPEATAKALARLTQTEILEVGDLQFNPTIYLPRHTSGLLRFKLIAWVGRESRRQALADPYFRTTAQSLWDDKTGWRGLLQMMNIWGTFEHEVRHRLVYAVPRGIPVRQLDPEVRDMIEHLGGQKWLAR